MTDDATVSFMINEIREQGRVLERVKERLPEPPRDHEGTLHFLGCGDMFFAAVTTSALAPLLTRTPTLAWRSMDFRWVAPRLGPNDCVIAASVSGRTPRTLEAAKLAARAGARVIALTDDEHSPLASSAAEVVVLGAAPPEEIEQEGYGGYQHPVPQTKTFLAALYAELRLLGPDPKEELDRIPDRLSSLLPTITAEARNHAEWGFVEPASVVVLGSGPHGAIARYGAAKFLEYAVPAVGQCLEEYNHLEVFLADRTTRIILLAMDLFSAQRAQELIPAWADLGVTTIVISNSEISRFQGPRTREWGFAVRHPVESIFVEATALQAIAAYAAPLLGRDPNRWLGGVRTELLQAVSQKTIRASRVLDSLA